MLYCSHFSVSKQHSVVPSQVFEPEDGTYKDFSMSKNNRFTSAGQASKNIIQPPSCVLHFYNVPLTMDESIFQKVINYAFPWLLYYLGSGGCSNLANAGGACKKKCIWYCFTALVNLTTPLEPATHCGHDPWCCWWCSALYTVHPNTQPWSEYSS